MAVGNILACRTAIDWTAPSMAQGSALDQTLVLWMDQEPEGMQAEGTNKLKRPETLLFKLQSH